MVRLFGEILGERVGHFDCDASVHELLTSASIIGTLAEVFGEGILGSDGQIDRDSLRDIVFNDTTKRRKLEAILHPKVLDAGRRARSGAMRNPRQPDLFLIEVPLLYETDFPIERDADLVVATSPATQVRRLKDQRGLSDEMIAKINAAQLPIDHKIDRADLVIWNEGPEAEVREQIRLAAAACGAPAEIFD